MGKFDSFHKHLLSVFAQLPGVLQIELRESFHVIDYKGQSYVIQNFGQDNTPSVILVDGVVSIIDNSERDKNFEITNFKKKTGFIPIDGKKGLLNLEEAQCDFAFFDEHDLCFIEFKLNATSLQSSAITKNRWKSFNQLSNTVNLFDQKLNKNYEGLAREAYVCTPETYPRDDNEWKSLRVAFLEKHGVPLYEENHKIYK